MIMPYVSEHLETLKFHSFQYITPSKIQNFQISVSWLYDRSMGPEVIGDDLSPSSGGGWWWVVWALSGMFSQTDYFFFMIIFADWLLSPMSQKRNKRKKLEEQKEEVENTWHSWKGTKMTKEEMAFGGCWS